MVVPPMMVTRLSSIIVHRQRPTGCDTIWNGLAPIIRVAGSPRFVSSSSNGDSPKGWRPPPTSSASISKGKKKGPLAEMLSNIDINRRQDRGKFQLRDTVETSSFPATDTTTFLESAFPNIMSTQGFRKSTAASSSGFRGKAISAVSLLHGDYEDYDEDEPLEDGVEDPAGSLDVTTEEDADDSREDRKGESRQLLALEERRKDQQRRWIENSKPIEREQELDERGRSYGRGGRKTATARVYLFPGEGHITVNRRDMTDYFQRQSHRAMIVNPFVATKTCGMFDVLCSVEGGGLSGKAGAIRHGIARALEKYNPDFRPPLKVLGYLTRDSRMVERKKAGLKKARKAKQWVKR